MAAGSFELNRLALKFFTKLFYMYGCSVCLSVHNLHATRPEEGVGALETGVNSCEFHVAPGNRTPVL